mmetsp:Transcript_38714/g.102429  ORF Transcript_38714/g.102429 Transcript_38714/m.102429 type:complete len:181 (+) Transcript_38714:1-543(+)
MAQDQKTVVQLIMQSPLSYYSSGPAAGQVGEALAGLLVLPPAQVELRSASSMSGGTRQLALFTALEYVVRSDAWRAQTMLTQLDTLLASLNHDLDLLGLPTVLSARSWADFVAAAETLSVGIIVGVALGALGTVAVAVCIALRVWHGSRKEPEANQISPEAAARQDTNSLPTNATQTFAT